jgi:hypothetical protein
MGSHFLRALQYHGRRATAKLGIKALKISGFYDGYFNHWRGDIFEYAERAGFHILPVHYYSPIPSSIDMARPRRSNSLLGINMDVDGGLNLANTLIEKYATDLERLFSGSGPYRPINSSFHPLDAALAYAYIREQRPHNVIEIGSGMSTLVIAAAINDGNLDTHFSCIEPFPPAYLHPNPMGVSEVVERPLQDLSLDRFKALKRGDVLFIDSTHVVRFNSDVVYEILEILPCLAAGVIVHVHDIFLPNDYPESWIKRHRYFWSEQYLLQAFLSMNESFRIELLANTIRSRLSNRTKTLVDPSTSDVEPASLWMRRV